MIPYCVLDERYNDLLNGSWPYPIYIHSASLSIADFNLSAININTTRHERKISHA